MTRLRAEDLPPALRRQLERQVASTAPQQSVKLPQVGRGTNRWTCAACHETFTAYATAERHSDEHQHHRIDLDVS